MFANALGQGSSSWHVSLCIYVYICMLSPHKIQKIKSFVDNLLSCCCHYNVFPLTPQKAALQVVFRNYLVCKTLSANIDFGNLYKKRQKKENKAAASTRHCSSIRRRQRLAKMPKGTKTGSILFGAHYHCNATLWCSDIKSLAHWRHKGCLLTALVCTELICNVFDVVPHHIVPRSARDVCHMPSRNVDSRGCTLGEPHFKLALKMSEKQHNILCGILQSFLWLLSAICHCNLISSMRGPASATAQKFAYIKAAPTIEWMNEWAKRKFWIGHEPPRQRVSA